MFTDDEFKKICHALFKNYLSQNAKLDKPALSQL